MYVPELDRIVLRDNLASREFNDQSQVHKTTLMTRILQLVHEICVKGIHVTKRDLYVTGRRFPRT